MNSKLSQNDIEHLQDLLTLGKITSDQANVEKVRMARFQLVTTRLPSQVRKALDNAVRDGILGHLKRDGRKPEAYYHPDFEHFATQARREHEKNVLTALLSVVEKPT